MYIRIIQLTLMKSFMWVRVVITDVIKKLIVNTTDGGEGTSGNKMSRETRDKMSEKKKGRHLSEDHKQLRSDVEIYERRVRHRKTKSTGKSVFFRKRGTDYGERSQNNRHSYKWR